MKRQLEGEADSLRLYGENISPAKYEVLLNNRDRDYYGDKLMEVFLSGMGAKLPPEARAKIRLAGETVPIDGGLVLRAGAVETNCALSMLLAESRRETETRVSRILFGDSN